MEKRLCLGGMAASTIADFAPADAPMAETSHILLLSNRDESDELGELHLAPHEPADEPPVENPQKPVAPAPTTSTTTNESVNETVDLSTERQLLTPALGDTPLVTFTPIEPPSSEEKLVEGWIPPLGSPEDPANNSSAAGTAAPGATTTTAATPVAINFPAAGAPSIASGGAGATGDQQIAQQATMTVAEAQLNAGEVELLLKRASKATASNDAIIAVVDRNGRILGVRVEEDVLAAIPEQATLTFAIDGAVAKARTAALFSNGELATDAGPGSAAPLTSRTVRFISQTTITQREVESNPNLDGGSLAEANASTVRGPGFVAPIGLGGHFPPEVFFTPPVDLFAIEHTNRDSNIHPGLDGVRGTADDILLRTNGVDADGELLGRFNLDPAFVDDEQALYAPESYGHVENSGWLPDAQSRGIATLPGGIPLFRDADLDGFGDTLVGGIGVFFPGEDGFATFEQGFVPGIGQTEAERTNAPKVLEAEFIALAAAGGSRGAQAWFPGAKVGDIGGVPAVENLDLPFGRLDLVGITLEGIGPGSSKTGIRAVLDRGAEVGPGVDSGADQPLVNTFDGFHRDGKIVAEGWLVTPHGSAVDNITAADVQLIIDRAIAAANETRAAVRLPLGSRTRMVFAVADTNGEILGLFRMNNATTFSIDVAVAKARNVAYYADADDLQPIDQVVEAGTAFTNRTFRFLAEPRYPSGIDRTVPPPFSILNDDDIVRLTAENAGAPAPVSDFQSVAGHDAFFPMTNFRDPGDVGVMAAAGPNQRLANQNGIVFFPGSTPLYKDGQLIGGFGVSGDGVDQDDVVTFLGAQGFLPEAPVWRADEVFFRGVRLPYQKFLRNPFG